MFVTFLLSAAAHELVMAVVTKKIRYALDLTPPFPVPIPVRYVDHDNETWQDVPLYFAAYSDSADRCRPYVNYQA